MTEIDLLPFLRQVLFRRGWKRPGYFDFLG